MIAQQDLYFELHVDYATRRIALHGELDVAVASCLGTAVAHIQHSRSGEIVIDLADVTFMDAAGLGALVAARAAQHERGDRLTIDHAGAEVRRVFLTSRLAALLDD